MCPAPSHTRTGKSDKDAFVGRRRELDLFENLLWEPQRSDTYRVLSLYGVGGQGKTALIEQYVTRLQNFDCREIPVARLDFDLHEHRSLTGGLIAVRHQLRRYGVSTHAFDIAYGRYFAATQPSRDLRTDHPEFFQFNEDSILGDLADIGATAFNDLDLPLPGGKLVYSLLARLSNKVADWYHTRGHSILERLDRLGLQELATELPVFLGYDICGRIQKHPRFRPVLLVDTYEALWRERALSAGMAQAGGDTWLRRLVEESPGTFVVVAGRRRVAWEAIDPTWASWITTHALGRLDDGDGQTLLTDAGVLDESVRRFMLSVAVGHPLSLKVSLRYYQMLQQAGAQPTASDLPRTHREILERFFDHLEPSLRGLMSALAVPRVIYRALWGHLARSGFSAFDLHASADVLAEVFFRALGNESFSMHERVREHLIAEFEQKDPEFLRRARLAVFDFFDRASSPDQKHRDALAPSDLGRSLASGDECLSEAAEQLIAASPGRYIEWLTERLSHGGGFNRGSKIRARLVDEAQNVLGSVGTSSLLNAARVARLELEANPWAEGGIALLQRIADLLGESNMSSEMLSQLRRIAWHLLRANRQALPKQLGEMLRRHPRDDNLWPGLDMWLALWTNDTQSAAALVERWLHATEKPLDSDFLWNAMCSVAYAGRLDLAKELFGALRSERKDAWFLLTLARLIDGFNFCGHPEFARAAAECGFDSPDATEISNRLATVQCGTLAHQTGLAWIDSLVQMEDREAARGLLDVRFPPVARDRLAHASRAWRSDGVEDRQNEAMQTVLDSIGREIKAEGFLLGYIATALVADDTFSTSLQESARKALSFELARRSAISTNLGGTPARCALHDPQLELAVNDRAECMLFVKDGLFCWRSQDWVGFREGFLVQFADVRRGVGRTFGIPIDQKLRSYFGEGARLLLVYFGGDSSEPISGHYVPIYGQIS